MTDCTITAVGAVLHLRIPSPKEDLFHTVEVPCTLAGVKLLHKMLLRRQRADGPHYIGTEASPTQRMVEEWLAREREERKAERLHAELEIIELDL